jgi:hypothetical protein
LQALEDADRRLGLVAEDARRLRERNRVTAELADLRRRIARLEARIAGV